MTEMRASVVARASGLVVEVAEARAAVPLLVQVMVDTLGRRSLKRKREWSRETRPGQRSRVR